MKKLFLIITLCITATAVLAQQEYKGKVSGSPKEKTVYVSVEKAKLIIEGYNGSEIMISGSGNEAPPARATGLKPIYNTATDNTGLGLEYIEDGNTIRITKALRKDAKYVLKIPQGMNLKIQETSWGGGSKFDLKNISGEIEVKSNTAEISISNAESAVIASTTSGNITVVFTKINPEKTISIANISGEVDVTVPASSKASLQLNSISGEIYTDFDLEYGDDTKKDEDWGGKRIGGGSNVKANINGGGVSMTLKSISGNVYLRKSK